MLFVPYAFYLYKLFPDVGVVETRYFSFTSYSFDSVRTFMYFVFSKLVPLVLLLIWFTTCKHWWYYSIAIPISVYIFQLISLINEDTGVVDEMEFIYSLPFTLIILTILFFVRSKISVFLKATDLKRQADEFTENITSQSLEDKKF